MKGGGAEEFILPSGEDAVVYLLAEKVKLKGRLLKEVSVVPEENPCWYSKNKNLDSF